MPTLMRLSTTLLVAMPCFAQDVRSLLEAPPRESQPALGLPLNAAAVSALGLCADSSSQLDGNPSRYFQLVKIEAEGSGDIVYSGPHVDPRTCEPVGEGNWTIILKRDVDSAVELFRGGGVIQAFARPSRGVLQLVLYAGPCCDDFEDAWTFVRLERSSTGMKAQVYDQILTTIVTSQVRPQRWFESPVPFHVAHEGYKFRYAPALDDSTEGLLTRLGRRGNALAEFHNGAPGMAVAESRDTDGRIWWLVLIDGRYTDSRVSQTGQRVLEDRWDFGFPRPRWLGWMSSRYLKADRSLQGTEPPPRGHSTWPGPKVP